MKYTYPLLFIIILIPVFSFAQSNYKPGYVVALNGDTLKGYINFKEWEKNPEKIDFKRELNSNNAEIFTAENSEAFAITGLEYFKCYKVTVSRGPVKMADIKVGVDTTYVNRVVFLRLLSTGNNIQLFSYTDEIKTRYYILDRAGTQPAELIYHVYYAPENFSLVETQNRFREQLAYYAKEYNASGNKLDILISTAQYTESDMIKIIRRINGDAAPQFTPASRSGLQWHAGIGVTDNSLVFINDINYPAKSSILPTVTGGFDLFIDKNTQRFSLRADVTLSENQHSFASGSFANQPFAGGYSSSLSNIIQRTIAISPQILYNIYNSDRFKFFIDAGVSVNISSYNKYYFTENFSGIASTVTPQFPTLRSFWLTAPVKAGITLNKQIEIYAGYALSTRLTPNGVGYKGKLTTYHAGINYLFGVK